MDFAQFSLFNYVCFDVQLVVFWERLSLSFNCWCSRAVVGTSLPTGSVRENRGAVSGLFPPKQPCSRTIFAANRTGFAEIYGGLMCVGLGFLRNPGIFGGIEPPKMRGCSHARLRRDVRGCTRSAKARLLNRVCEFFRVRKKFGNGG